MLELDQYRQLGIFTEGSSISLRQQLYKLTTAVPWHMRRALAHELGLRNTAIPLS